MTKALDTPLRWVGAVTAVISLVLAANQLVKVASEIGERQRRVGELRAVADQQRSAADYRAAWASLGEAVTIADQGSSLANLTGRLDQVRTDLRTAQEDLAMAWLEHVSVPAGQTFSAVVEPLVPVVTRGLLATSGPRKADLLAHLGWSYFLKSRDGPAGGDPEALYRQALEADPANPYAHANWGHLIVWQRGPFAEASRHFVAAVAAGRERPYVRRLQLAAYRLYGSVETEEALLRTVDEMRRNGEPIEADVRRAVFSAYYSAFNGDEMLARVIAVLPPAEHIATIRALFFDETFDKDRAPMRDAVIALLLESAGRSDEALATWRSVKTALASGGDGRVADRATAAILRLSAVQRPSGRSRAGGAARARDGA